ncbi:MAG TPA: glycosyltransferase family 2 protein [Candidatus Saccharimonadales bacterium]|nr:glycosyltransferase family 2 protein [Candidatus Saccharimonadales bacterium]
MQKGKQHLRKIAEKVLPKNTRRRKLAGKLYGRIKRIRQLLPGAPAKVISYSQWVQQCEPHVWIEPRTYKHQPLISIVVPAYNTPLKYVKPLLASLHSQLYPNWQLCVADGSTDERRAKAIAASCKGDKRITYKRLKQNYGIVGNTNAGVKLAKGEFVGLLDHDDILSPHALLEIVDALNHKPKTDFFYSDEDKISDDGKERSLPFFKPDWSPTLLESVNYITHFAVIRRTLLEKIGMLREGFDGSQDYDLFLRVTDHTNRIVHIPKILYHWRIADGSTAGPIENKNYADDAGQRALMDHVARKKVKAEVLGRENLPTNYRLRYEVPEGAKASIIIPFKDKIKLTQTCIESILEKTTYKNYEIILISNNSVEDRTFAYLKTLKNEKIKIYYYNKPFNYSKINNFGRKKAKGDFIVLLNNDTEVISEDWLDELIGVAAQPWAGAVGPLLFYPNNKIQHAGITVGMKGAAGHPFRLRREDALTPFGRPYWARNYLAVTAACLVIDAKKYDEVHGLDETFVMAGQDVAFGIRLHEKGYLNVFWPHVQMYHYENVSVGSYQNAPAIDFETSMKYYGPYMQWQDPYFNPNLNLDIEDIALRETYV